ncbi:MAG: hypothetical protein AB8B83_09190 [Bdellovibrionales bacterium]
MQKKITLHLKHLLDESKITKEEAERLIGLSEHKSGGSIFRNLMVIFGTLSIVAGFLGLAPNPHVGGAIASLILLGAYALYYNADDSWKFIAQSFGFLGTLGVTAWLVYSLNFIEFSSIEKSDIVLMWVLVSCILGLVAFTLHNKVLAALLPLAIAQLVGASAFYTHASYYLSIREPSIAILVFGAIAGLSYFAATRLRGIYDDLCTIISRVALFIVNMAFWIGSLWGDHVGNKISSSGFDPQTSLYIGEAYFTVGWALLLLCAVWWGANRGLGYVVNLSIVFLGIHFYTQYFETVGANPIGLLVGGVLIFSSSMLWWKYKDQLQTLLMKR